MKIVTHKSDGAVEIQKGPDEINTYANIVGITFGTDEVILHFGLRNTEDPKKGTGVVKIYMSSAHAKRLANALVNAVQKMENVFGEINADPFSKLSPDKLQQLQILGDDKNDRA